MNRSLVFDLATATFIAKREDALFLGPPGTGKSHLAQAIGKAAIQQGYRVIYREAHTLLNDIADATLRSEEHTSELQSPCNLVCRLLLEKKKKRDLRRQYPTCSPLRNGPRHSTLEPHQHGLTRAEC